MMYPIFGNCSIVYVCLGYIRHYFMGVEGIGDIVQPVSQIGLSLSTNYEKNVEISYICLKL
jgi:hypothetical protein